MMLVAHYDPLWLLNVAKCIRHGTPPHRHIATKDKKLFTIYKDIFNQVFVEIPSSQKSFKWLNDMNMRQR